jgi:hypothetical protein
MLYIIPEAFFVCVLLAAWPGLTLWNRFTLAKTYEGLSIPFK